MFGNNTLKIESIGFDFQDVAIEYLTLAKLSLPGFDTASDVKIR
jgi:hypothetical protein